MKINGLEDGIAKFLVNAGIPKSQIVLGFHPVEVSAEPTYLVGAFLLGQRFTNGFPQHRKPSIPSEKRRSPWRQAICHYPLLWCTEMKTAVNI